MRPSGFPNEYPLGSQAVLGGGQKAFRELGGELFEFLGALWSSRKLLIFGNEIVAVTLKCFYAKFAIDQVGGLSKNVEAAGAERSQEGSAVPFSHTDVILIHREGHNIETMRFEAFQDRDLCRCDLHASRISGKRAGIYLDKWRTAQRFFEEWAPRELLPRELLRDESAAAEGLK